MKGGFGRLFLCLKFGAAPLFDADCSAAWSITGEDELGSGFNPNMIFAYRGSVLLAW